MITPRISQLSKHIEHIVRGILVAALATIATGCSESPEGLKCSTPATADDVILLMAKTRGVSAAQVADVMKSCPTDLPLGRLLYRAYVISGECELAVTSHDNISALKTSPIFPLEDREDLFLCFYSAGDYERAITFYNDRRMAQIPYPSIMSRDAYAQSLLRAGRTLESIQVLREIELINYPGITDQFESISYELAVLTLAQALYTNNEQHEAMSAARRYLSFSPGSPDGHEVLLAAAARAENISTSDLKQIYCGAIQMQIEDVAENPSYVRDDLQVLEGLIIDSGQPVDCKAEHEART